jgi:hypothetical protein
MARTEPAARHRTKLARQPISCPTVVRYSQPAAANVRCRGLVGRLYAKRAKGWAKGEQNCQ